jgi:hypothetical protein
MFLGLRVIALAGRFEGLDGHEMRDFQGLERDVGDETWEFRPGSVVRCEKRQGSSGEYFLIFPCSEGLKIRRK